jgi:hypothetical protein
MLDFLYRCWESEIRSSDLCCKHFTSALSPQLHLKFFEHYHIFTEHLRLWTRNTQSEVLGKGDIEKMKEKKKKKKPLEELVTWSGMEPSASALRLPSCTFPEDFLFGTHISARFLKLK